MSANTDKLARMGIVHSAPTSSHDEVEEMCLLLEECTCLEAYKDRGRADPQCFAHQEGIEAAALLRKQAAELDFWQREGIGDQLMINGLKAQIAEMRAPVQPTEPALRRAFDALTLVMREMDGDDSPLTQAVATSRQELLTLLYAHPPTSEWNDAIEAAATLVWNNGEDVRMLAIAIRKLKHPSVQPTEPYQAKADADRFKDAERYRWLRKNWVLVETVAESWGREADGTPSDDGSDLDVCIDVAMTKELDAAMTEYKPGQIANND